VVNVVGRRVFSQTETVIPSYQSLSKVYVLAATVGAQTCDLNRQSITLTFGPISIDALKNQLKLLYCFTDPEKGCHYLHVQDELQRTVQYSKLHKTALLHVLARLETNSDVIRVTDRCYMPLM
jgi:hypothetical protein